MPDLEQEIRERAYYLWIADGSPDGNADAHWLAAQREVLATSIEGSSVEPRAAISLPETTNSAPIHQAKAAAPKKRKRRAA